ncbi:MAG: restriction endonuclease subunit S [Capsulimonadaceae bacterium]
MMSKVIEKTRWRRTRLKYVVSFVGGGTPSKGNADYWRGEIPWVSPKDMAVHVIHDTEDHISQQAVAASSTRVLQPGAILVVCRSGVLKHSIPVAINAVPVALNQDMRALLTTEAIDPAYLRYFIAGQEQRLLADWRKAGATVESLEYELMADTELVLPPLSVQRTIIRFLDRETAHIDELIDAQERLLDVLAEKRRAVITQAITYGFNEGIKSKKSCIPWLEPIPSDWQVPSVGSRFEVQLGKMLDEKRIHGRNLAPYLRNVDVQWNSINIEDLPQMDFSDDDRDRYSLRSGDIMICEGGEIGRCAIWRGGLANCFYQKALHRLRPKSDQDDPEFFVLFMTAACAAGAFLADGNGSTIEHLPAEKLRRVRYPAPPIEEQRAIVKLARQRLGYVDDVTDTAGRIIGLLRDLKASIISSALTKQSDWGSSP